MTTLPMDKAIEAYFDGKPDTFKIFGAVYEQLQSIGPFDVSVKSQIGFSVKRKFAWFWLYNVTLSDLNGILHTMLCIDRGIKDSHVRNIDQISKNRWNHQIVIRTLPEAESQWLRGLLEAAYSFGSSD